MTVKDTEHPRVSRSHAPRESPGLLSLYHALLITATNGPLSQRMLSPFSSSESRVRRRPRDSILESQLESPACFISLAMWRRRVNRTAIFSRPREEENFPKNMFLLRIFPSLGESDKAPGWLEHPLHPLSCSSPAALSGHQSQSFTQLFIILISILPFPSSHYLSLPPKLTWHTPHTHFLEACVCVCTHRRPEERGFHLEFSIFLVVKSQFKSWKVQRLEVIIIIEKVGIERNLWGLK